VPTQALFLMNSRFVIEQARAAAARLIAGTASTPQERVTRAYRETLGRAPTAAEVERAMIFVHAAEEEAPKVDAGKFGTSMLEQRRAARRPQQRNPVEAPLPAVAPEVSAWEHLYQALFASAEFRYRG
jgi:hypothetical protein